MALSWRVAALLTVPPLMWAGNAVVGRLMVGQVPPLTLNFIRWLLTVALLLLVAGRALRPLSRIRERWPYLLAVGATGVGLYNALQYSALVTSSAMNVTLVAASTPVWMLAVGALFFAERPQPKQVLGTVFSLAGVAVVLGRGSVQTLLQVQLVPGDLFILLAALSWAFYSWLLARPPASMRGTERPDWNWAAMLLIQALFGLCVAGLFAVGEQAAGAAPIHWSAGTLGALLYVSLGASILAYRCWGLGVATGGPALASFFANLTPLFAALLSTLLLGEVPQLYHAAAFALIVAGIVVSARG